MRHCGPQRSVRRAARLHRRFAATGARVGGPVALRLAPALHRGEPTPRRDCRCRANNAVDATTTCPAFGSNSWRRVRVAARRRESVGRHHVAPHSRGTARRDGARRGAPLHRRCSEHAQRVCSEHGGAAGRLLERVERVEGPSDLRECATGLSTNRCTPPPGSSSAPSLHSVTRSPVWHCDGLVVLDDEDGQRHPCTAGGSRGGERAGGGSGVNTSPPHATPRWPLPPPPSPMQVAVD